MGDVLPAAAIAVVVIGVNLMADGLNGAMRLKSVTGAKIDANAPITIFPSPIGTGRTFARRAISSLEIAVGQTPWFGRWSGLQLTVAMAIIGHVVGKSSVAVLNLTGAIG